MLLLDDVPLHFRLAGTNKTTAWRSVRDKICMFGLDSGNTDTIKNTVFNSNLTFENFTAASSS